MRGGFRDGNESGERSRAADPPDAAKSGQQDSICWYVALGVPSHGVCERPGQLDLPLPRMRAQHDKAEGRVQTLSRANEHAGQCRAISNPRYREAADVRAELPRIDARAAAGIALSAAVLIGAVGQAQPMPILAFMVVAAALLTLVLLLFFTVLLPAPAKASKASIRRWASSTTGKPWRMN